MLSRRRCQIKFKAPALGEEGAQLCSTELTPLGKSGGAVDAIATLDAINKAVSYTEDPEYIDAQYFLIVYTPETKDVKIERYSEYAKISDDYIKAEQAHSGKKTVLVEADAIEELKLAYPNYFLDVNSFLERAIKILG